jgi:FkbM family methyltransferase
MGASPRRLVEPLAHRWPWSRGRRFARAVRVVPRSDLVHIGSEYGGWVVPDSMLSERSVCYCGGVGADISFDLGLIERYGCTVHAFDPTPRAAALASETASREERFRFLPYGLWGEDRTLEFFAPAGAEDPAQVENWSARGEAGGLSLKAECKSLSSLTTELGHERIDLLKLDIEGAEYEVLDAALREDVEFRVLCVEFHKTPSIEPMIDMTSRLETAGFEAVALSGFDVTFVRSGG